MILLSKNTIYFIMVWIINFNQEYVYQYLVSIVENSFYISSPIWIILKVIYGL